MIPSIEIDSGKKEYLTPQTLCAPYRINQAPVITTAGAFDADSGTPINTTSFAGNIDTTYASADALYLVSTQYPYYYDFEFYKIRSAIYKFALVANLSYRGRGFVDKSILNQYSLSGRNGILRIATTSGFSWTDDGIDNTVYTLSAFDNKVLQPVGVLHGLGHENETIHAVRFVGATCSSLFSCCLPAAATTIMSYKTRMR